MENVAGYEDYEREFREVSLPEYRWLAQTMLTQAIEDSGCQMDGSLIISMPDYISKDKCWYTFQFSIEAIDWKKSSQQDIYLYRLLLMKGVSMAFYKYKGKRIRASDKNLVYRFCAGTLLFLFIAVLLLLNMGQLMRTDWEHFSLLDNGVTLSTYNFITIGIATGVCALVAFLYYRFFHDSFKKLLHRQKLSRMILDNKWYEAQTVQDSGFFH